MTWMQSSRVGVSTSAWTSWSSGSTYSISGRPNAAVLPEPVCAWPIMSQPVEQRRDRLLLDRAGLLVADVAQRFEHRRGQAEVGESSHCATQVSRVAQTRLHARAAHVRSVHARGIEQQLAGRAALGEVDLRLRGLGQRVGRADDDAQLAARRCARTGRRAPRRAARGRSRQCVNQKPTTVRDVRSSLPVRTSFCSREAIP